jgi:DNA-binding NarL/FixJ family response regulator
MDRWMDDRWMDDWSYNALAPLYVSYVFMLMLYCTLSTRSTGPQAAQALRAKGYSGVLIGVTGHAQPADIQEFKQCGADAVLPKPLKFEVLTNLVRDILSSKDRGKDASPCKSP